jgi:hypothetical protein
LGEHLEARQLLAGDGTGVPAADIGSAATETPVFACPAALQRIDPSPDLPAPIMADYNLDGDFTSEDFVTFFHHRTHLSSERSPTPGYDISEDFDLVESMQWTPYEGDDVRDSTHPCAIYEIASHADPAQVARQDRYADGDTWVQESTIRIGPHNSANYRAAVTYDPESRPQTFTLSVYRAGGESIYSRMQVEYDTASRVRNQLTWIYGEDGGLRRSTTSSVFYVDDKLYRSTRVEYFGDDGRQTLRSVHYYDAQLMEVAIETTEYDDGVAGNVIRARYDADGEPLDPTPLADPNYWTSKFAPQAPQSTYLREFEDAYRAIADTYSGYYRDVLRMNRLPSQEHLEDILEVLQLGQNEANYYRQLNRYFSVALDVARAIQQQDFSQVYDRHSMWIDPATGDWSPGFKEFVDREQLTLPLPPLRISGSVDGLSQADRDALTDSLRHIAGESPTDYFQAKYNSPKPHVRDLLESMRFAKAQIKLQEYKVVDKFPTYERVVAPDKPDLQSLGYRQGILLTGWYFFAQDENGVYERDEVSAEVIARRVQSSLTDEDTFYAMNLEEWELDGPPEVINASLVKLKRAADLIHEANPNLLIGFYRLMPRRRPHAAYEGADSERYQAWMAENDYIAAALEHSIDVIFPSLYVLHLGNGRYTTEELWKTYATESINEAKRIGGGKPVVPYVALYYHRNGMLNPKGWRPVEPEFLLYQLATISTLADGVLVYDDLHRSWDSLSGEGIDEAMALFRRIVDRGRVPQLLEYYEDAIARNHDELIEKLELEKQLIEKQKELIAATVNKNARLAASLVREISLLEYDLRNKIDLWSEIKTFISGIL